MQGGANTHINTVIMLSLVWVLFLEKKLKTFCAYIGVQNKYCAVCEQGAGKMHECFMNWARSSSSMESDMILEGFSKAEQQHSV